MPALAAPEEDEAYLYALLSDESGIDQAELLFQDQKSEDMCFRVRPYQWAWYRSDNPQQAELSSRTVGKSLGIQLRAVAHIFCNPGYDMLITAPELNSLEPVIREIEKRLYSSKIITELLPKGRGSAGARPVTHHPFQLSTVLGSTIYGRLPQRDGHGVRGMHVKWLEMDECFPAGALVCTRRGQVSIDEVIVGDEVLTHKNRWRRVTATSKKTRPTVILCGQGHPGLEASTHHPFWAAQTVPAPSYYMIDDGRASRGFVRNKRFVEPEQWIPACEMEGKWWSSPLTFPPHPQIPSFRSPGEHGELSVPPCKQDCDDFFWMVGLWIAEGSVGDHQVYFSIHQKEVPYVQERLERLGLRTSVYYLKHNLGANVVVQNARILGDWLVEHCGKGAHNKEIPVWVLGLRKEWRKALLEGLVYGDGFEDPDERYEAGRWKLTTVSKKLSVSTRLLALGLGYSVSWYWNPPRKVPSVIRGREVKPTGFYQIVGDTKGQGFTHNQQYRYTAVRKVTETGEEKELYDLTVEEDHSYLIDGIYCSNSQDYPVQGYYELIETCTGEGTQWRVHGVVNGVGGWFYDVTKAAVETPPLRATAKKSDTDWELHRIVAQCRPDWTDKERQSKIEKYGSRDAPDYGRNVLGLPGPAENVIFILHRLIKCTDDDPGSDYNSAEYVHVTIRDADMDRDHSSILDFINLPESHKKYPMIYIGMDVGYINDPSEILVFADYLPTAAEARYAKATKDHPEKAFPAPGDRRFKLITRISLQNIPAPDQMEVVLHLIDFYSPAIQAFGIDKTGNGLPLYQDITRQLENNANETNSARARAALKVIKGYNFSENVLVEIDPAQELLPGMTIDEQAKEAGIYRRVVEVSTDALRELVDTERMWLPWDRELISTWNAQTYHFSKMTTDAYGRRRLFSQGDFHTLDAARMAALAQKQRSIEELLAQSEPAAEPVLDVFNVHNIGGIFQQFDPNNGMKQGLGGRQGSGW